MSPTMVLALRQVTKLYGLKPVFRDVSLEMPRGELLLVTGPNGAGKSTLLRVMAGLSRPTAGEVVRSLHAGRIGYLGHAPFLYPALSGLENLRFWAGLHGVSTDEENLLRALRSMDLESAVLERVSRYSRGMTQRLNLARVFLTEPELILLDEPATGLDAHSGACLRQAVASAKERGAALVWVSHAPSEDAAAADRILTLRNGRVAYLGPAGSYPAEAAC